MDVAFVDELDVLVYLHDKPLCLRYARCCYTMSGHSHTWPLAVRCCPGISSTHPALVEGAGNLERGYKDDCRGSSSWGLPRNCYEGLGFKDEVGKCISTQNSPGAAHMHHDFNNSS